MNQPPPVPIDGATAQVWRSRGKTLLICWSVVIGGILAGAFCLDQALASAALPACGLKTLTGLDCPGCGGTRSTVAMLRFELVDAFRYHAVWVLTLGYLVFVLCAETVLFLMRKPSRTWFPAKVLWVWLVAILVMTVLRNVPGLEMLKP